MAEAIEAIAAATLTDHPIAPRDRTLPLVLGGLLVALGVILLRSQTTPLRPWHGVAVVCVVAGVAVRLIALSRERDVTTLRLEVALREQDRLAPTDPLTGLHNRRSFEETLQREALRRERTGYVLGLVVIDVDHFKAVNDTFGPGRGSARRP